MCFSPYASFGFGSALIGIGVYTIAKAAKTDSRYLALAAIPFAFGIQQIAEGMVWRGFEHNDMSTVRSYAFLYLFFVWMIWPIWAGFAAAMLETHQRHRYFFYGLALAGLLLGGSVYIPYIWHPDWMQVQIARFSIAYTSVCALPDQIFSPNLADAIYLFLACAPFLLSSHHSLRIFGAMLVLFIPITYLTYLHAFASVFCFFAALSSAHIAYIVTANRCPNEDLQRLNLISEEKHSLI